MNDIASVSQGELTQRRSMLRRHRRLKQIKSVWRTLAIGGILGGLVWAVTQPVWVVTQSRQISVVGNKLLTTQAIASLLKISYPQNLLEIKPEALAKSLEAQPTIADANVKRSLFPPRLTVQVTERVPVAIAITKKSATPGLIAADGVWIPQQSYTPFYSSDFQIPKLKVVGQLEQYQPHWNQLYRAVSNLKVKVSEIDWQNPDNLILKTELGAVHLGTFSPKLNAQLQKLETMRPLLPPKVNLQEVAYIDLTNPEDPLLHMTAASLQKKKSVKPAPRPQ